MFMLNIGCWNIRGLNGFQKQKNVSEWIRKNNLSMYSLVETKMHETNMKKWQHDMAMNKWQFFSNGSTTDTARIIVGWDKGVFDVVTMNISPQWVTCRVHSVVHGFDFTASFFYGHNTPVARQEMWEYIKGNGASYKDNPWVLMGDFNATMKPTDSKGGDPIWSRHKQAFGDCMHHAELHTVPYRGIKYTWHNGQQGEDTILKKLDWVIGNTSMAKVWPNATAHFFPRSVSDHSSMMLQLRQDHFKPKPSFKFLNFWAEREDFIPQIARVWQAHIHGSPMFRFTSKLQLIKAHLKNWHKVNRSNISILVAKAKADWDEAQLRLDADPIAEETILLERNKAKIYLRLSKDEEAFFKQRSRIQWLTLGDRNTTFFHRSLLHRKMRNKITCLEDGEGNIVHDQEGLGKVAVGYYRHLMNEEIGTGAGMQDYGGFPRPISDNMKEDISGPITKEEIQAALFSISDGKASGPDGFSALFFKAGWSVVGEDFVAAVQDFFNTNSMPKCVNATTLALIPKVENPSTLDEYRPISCCNVIYKSISKVLANRLKKVLEHTIGYSQNAFIPGRNIADAVLLSQELMHNYHLRTGPPRCAMKIDLRKAFDTIRWEYILQGLNAIGIPQAMVNWIKSCIATPHFSISINGELQGWFKSSRGIRQGDPLSPYLFVLAMEGLNGHIKEATANPDFKYHWRCRANKTTNICFADDLLLYCHADMVSVDILNCALHSFMNQSGMSINPDKSSIFLTGIDQSLQRDIQAMLGFQIKTPPITYLGVPLLTKRLTNNDCNKLVETITARIKLWTSASLSYAGRLQLIKSTLFSMQVYWSSMFILPVAVIRRIESIMARFLWRGPSLEKNGAKVSWANLCYPLNEGGLGIKSLREWNKAALLKLVWRILTNKDSGWAGWVHSVLLKGRNFWEVKASAKSSWNWRKIMDSRRWCKGLFRTIIGDGRETSLWFDPWLPEGRRLFEAFTPRILATTGLGWDAKVSSIINNGVWTFPNGHLTLQQAWSSIPFHPKQHTQDKIIWPAHASGIFSIASAWNLLRSSKENSTLHGLIWYNHHVPRYSLILWLASRGRLSTMDRPMLGTTTGSRTCILCGSEDESHNHLFFQCTYTGFFWNRLTSFAQQQWPEVNWENVLQWAGKKFIKKKRFNCLLAKHMLATAIYFIWIERNHRIFQRQNKPVGVLVQEAITQIRLLLMNYTGHIPNYAQDRWKL